jgi:site-specific recombinase XerD
MQDWRENFKRLDGAYAPATIRGYLADFEAFARWCARNEDQPIPAACDSIISFIEQEAQSRAMNTIERRLYAIRRVHKLLGLSDPTDVEDVRLALRRIKRSKFARPKQAKGLTSDYLKRFLDAQPDTLIGLRNRAMLALGYELLTRRSELVALRVEDIEFRADGTIKAIIRRSKADPFGHGRLAFTSKGTADLIRDWLARREIDAEPLFCPVYHGKAIDRSITDMTVRRVLSETAERAGCSPDEAKLFSGHSMRVGAAQDLLCLGYDGIAIMRAGGWKSPNTLLRYIEVAEHNVWALADRAGSKAPA